LGAEAKSACDCAEAIEERTPPAKSENATKNVGKRIELESNIDSLRGSSARARHGVRERRLTTRERHR
jgi:hypothetical protein